MKKFLCLVINRQTNETLAEYMISVMEEYHRFSRGTPDLLIAKFTALDRFIAENRNILCRELTWKNQTWFVDTLELDETS